MNKIYFTNKHVRNLPVPTELQKEYKYLNHDGTKLYVDDNLKYQERILEIKDELYELDTLMLRNEIWYKNIDQSTIDVTYEAKKLELTNKREDIKTELASLNNLLNN